MVYSGVAVFGPWKTGNCTVLSKSVSRTSGKNAKYQCKLEVDFQQFYKDPSGTNPTAALAVDSNKQFLPVNTSCGSYSVGQGITCSFSVMSKNVAYTDQASGVGGLLLGLIIGIILLCVCVVCPICVACFKVFGECCSALADCCKDFCSGDCCSGGVCCLIDRVCDCCFGDETPGYSYEYNTDLELTVDKPAAEPDNESFSDRGITVDIIQEGKEEPVLVPEMRRLGSDGSPPFSALRDAQDEPSLRLCLAAYKEQFERGERPFARPEVRECLCSFEC
jgi:hypothetical protein